MALFVDYPVADGQEPTNRWFDAIDTAISRRKEYAVAQGWGAAGWQVPTAVAAGAELAPAMLNERRDCVERLITSGCFYIPTTALPITAMTTLFTWIKANVAGAASYFVDSGGGAWIWTNVPPDFTDPVGGAGPVGALDLPAGYEPYGRWWNELYVVLHEALSWIGVVGSPIADDSGNYGVELYFNNSGSSADAVKTAWKDSVDAEEGVRLFASPKVEAGPDSYYRQVSAYYIAHSDGTPQMVVRVYKMYVVPNFTYSILGAKIKLELKSGLKASAYGVDVAMNDWTVYAKVSTTDPRPYTTADWAYAGDDLIAGGYAVSGYTPGWTVEIADCDSTKVSAGATHYVQTRGFEVKPTAIPETGWWPVWWNWRGLVIASTLLFKLEFDG